MPANVIIARILTSRPLLDPLKMDIEAFRKAGYAAVDSICDYYATLQDRPVKAEVLPGYLIDSLPHEAPAQGEDFSAIAKDFQDKILPGITHWQHGRFFAYFPSISTFESMLAELYSASVSNPGFNWICSPACTELEQVTMDWCARMLGLGDSFLLEKKQGGGVIMGSASESALTAAMAAREKALTYLSEKEGLSIDDARQTYGQKLVIYGSTQTHSLGLKAAVLLGLTFRAVEVAEADKFALRGEALRKAIDRDAADGFVPFFVIATVGTTSTGAVDYIAEIGEVLKQYPTSFLHVDGAWAGVAYALPDRRDQLRLAELVEYADSFCTNMHKWGLVGFDCSLFFVRDRRNLTDAFDVTPPYLRSKEADSGAVIDYRNWQIALGRRFRSIKLWFVLRSYGTQGFQKHLETGIGQCERLALVIEESPIFELVTTPSLALLCFRLNPRKGYSDEELDLLNQRLHTRLDVRSDVFLTQTVLKSVERKFYCLRFAMGGARTTWEDVEKTWEVVVEEGQAVLKG
ncbi:putative aromatic-L-amino-acid decarboxylase [Papiliotrema laurentii]|uniref:Aromatic-L-amino-acid decarboxylase n=1 Tax=Papiliotrema laurentii TaxID=5418 RepID=A0AAD9FU33_PAPLA|nr:putative aromatic-L-amino-acid decarboxylase [Papiliotrema laurentii]